MENYSFYKKINRYVILSLYFHNVKYGVSRTDLINDAYKQYQYDVDNGVNDKDARKKCFKSINKKIKLASKNNIDQHKYRYSLITGAIYLFFSLIIMILGLSFQNNVNTLANLILYFISFIVGLGIFVYTIVTYKNRYYYDFIVVFGLLVFLVIAFVYSFGLCFTPETAYHTYRVSYIFPIGYDLLKYQKIAVDGDFSNITLKLVDTTRFYDFTLIFSAFVTILFSILYICDFYKFRKRKKY